LYPIIRPSLWVTTYPGVGNGLDPQYDADYPLELKQNYGYGGFHFAYDLYLDYAQKPLITGLGLVCWGLGTPSIPEWWGR